MTTKLNRRVPISANAHHEYQDGIETDLRRRARLFGSFGIVSNDAEDVDQENGACAVVVNASQPTSIDVLAGTVVFPNGEVVNVVTTDIQGVIINPTEVDAFVVRLEYGTVAAGPLSKHPVIPLTANPVIRVQTPREMLRIDTVTAYNALPASVKNGSVVLGICRYEAAELTTDNARDTYSFSRPWFSPVDTTHRSLVGSATPTPQNPHGQQISDFGVGRFTAFEALTGGPSTVLSKAVSYGRIAGTSCVDTIPANAFVVDTTGRVTGKAGARYAPLGAYPHRLISIFNAANQEVSGWIPEGRNVVAIVDPARFSAAVPVTVTYTTVQAGALPGVVTGSSIEVLQPTDNEVLSAGGGLLLDIPEPRVTFTDVGVIPMGFDLWLDNTGRVFKRPDVLYCNTRLDTLGAGPFAFTTQPEAPTRLRLAVTDYGPSFSSIQIQFTGVNAAGASITEIVTISGPLPSPVPATTEVTAQRVFTNNVFARITQGQVVARNGDGPSTTITVFAEYAPEDGEVANRLLLASVHWTGATVTNNYATGSHMALDRRPISRGGRATGMSPAMAMASSLLQVNSYPGFTLTVSQWATLAEDFSDPTYVDANGPVLPANSLSIPRGYRSRLIPLGTNFGPAVLRLVLLPLRSAILGGADFSVQIDLHQTNGTVISRTGTTSPGALFPPYLVAFPSPVPAGSCYAVRVTISPTSGAPFLPDQWAGWVLHLNDGPA